MLPGALLLTDKDESRHSNGIENTFNRALVLQQLLCFILGVVVSLAALILLFPSSNDSEALDVTNRAEVPVS